MAKEKNVTTEDLAGMVQRGFLEMREEFRGVHKRLDNIENGKVAPSSWHHFIFVQ